MKEDLVQVDSVPASSNEKVTPPLPRRETIFFAFDTDADRKALMNLIEGMWSKEDGLRVVAMSADSEMTRVEYLMEAIERYDDHYDRGEAQQEIWNCPDLAKWSWDAFENGMLDEHYAAASTAQVTFSDDAASRAGD